MDKNLKMDILKYFDKVYCINMDKRPDRWEQAQIEFKKLGIENDVIRWSGVENEDGNLGCTLSHLSIIKHCVTICMSFRARYNMLMIQNKSVCLKSYDNECV